MKNNKIASLVLAILGITFFIYITAAPQYQGTLLSKVVTVFNAQTVTGTSTATSSNIPTDDAQNFGVSYYQTAGSSPNINITYDESFDGVNWITTVGTLTASLTGTSTAGGSIQLPVAPLIRFNVTGNAGNGTSTVTMKFMKQ